MLKFFFLSWTLCHLLSLGWLAIFHNSCEENVILSIEKNKIISWRKTVTEKGQCTYQIFNSVVLKILRQWTCVDLFDNKFLSLVLLAQFSQTLSKVVVGWARDVQILQCEVQPIEWYLKITRPKGDYKFKVLRSIDDSQVLPPFKCNVQCFRWRLWHYSMRSTKECSGQFIIVDHWKLE